MGGLSTFSPASRHLVVWFPTYAWLATSVTTPFVYNAKLKHEQVEPRQRKILVAQETCRQIVSGAIGFLTSAAGILIGAKLGKRAADKTLQKVILGSLASCLGYAVIRPILGTDLFVHWMRRKGLMAFGPEGQGPAPAVSHTPEARMRNYLQAEQRRQEFFGRVQARMQFSARG